MLLCALPLAASAQSDGKGNKPHGSRDLSTPQSSQPRPERIVPPPQPTMIPQQKAGPKPEQRASLEQMPVGSGRVRMTVRVISAAPGAGGKDPRLSAVESNLATLPLRYGTYRLVEERSFDLDLRSQAQMDLPGGRSLVLSPSQLSSDGRIHVHLEVLGGHPEHARKMHTDYSIDPGGTLMVAGYRLDPDRPDAGTLFIAITQGVR
jgi:hypothetical protein